MFSYKTIISLIIIGFISVYSITIYNNIKTKKELKEKIEYLEVNNKSLQMTNTLYHSNIDDLINSNDSLGDRLSKSLKELKIKPKQVKEVITTSQNIEVIKEIKLKDTIFVNNFKLDTIIGDKMTNVNLKMSYPNKLSYSFEIINHQDILTEEYKSHLNPKDWFWNLFRKKKTFIRIWTINDNPNITTSQTKIIHLEK